MADKSLWAVVPAKRLAHSKTRLADIMSAAERCEFSLAMLSDVIETLKASPVDGVLVVTGDQRIVDMATSLGADVLVLKEDLGLCDALDKAAGKLKQENVAQMLIVPGDVPLISVGDIEALIKSHQSLPAVTLVGASRDGGTNALLCSPPDVIAFLFGTQSAVQHIKAASAAGIDPMVLNIAGFERDIDVAEDLKCLAKKQAPSNTYDYLLKTGLMPSMVLPDRLATQEALALVENRSLEDLMSAAAKLRDLGHGSLVSYSRKVFIPLTKLCRDVCHYCTFATRPGKAGSAYMSLDEVLEVARAGVAAGCKEALFTLGDKPELRYRAARKALAELGHETTLSYLREAAEHVFRETGLMPHINAGVMDKSDIAALRNVSVSQGIMLETISDRLGEKGAAHHGSPDKQPARRLACIEDAGLAKVPFTSGILIGIGETRRERIEALMALRDLHEAHGHIQEIILQPFRAKPGTLMAQVDDVSLQELLWTCAVARLIMGAQANIQTPPNLAPGALSQLINAGINDWGGISPVTPDHVNPEAPWPHLVALDEQTKAAGKVLVERLGVYPEYVTRKQHWLAEGFHTSVKQAVDASGLVRMDKWSPGTSQALPACDAALVILRPAQHRDQHIAGILDRASAGITPGEAEIVRLFSARGQDFAAVCDAADGLRRELVGDDVTYVVTRNINYTNICSFKCQFCAFSKGKLSENLRGRPYDLDMAEILRRGDEAWERGATELCMQGGIHPQYTGETYLNICRALKAAHPDLHIHAFSPLEIWQGARTSGVSVPKFLSMLMDAGLGSLPGTAAEILDDEIRAVICPDKINSAQWLDVMAAAHDLGLRSTATIMFGHVEQPHHWARHLSRVAKLQRRTGGFTEFVPLPFVHMETPIYLKGRARRGPTFRESILMHAIARLVFHEHLPNIQASWVKMGEDGVKLCLQAGANDAGGTLMNETITRSAGAKHGQEMVPERLEALIASIGRVPRQRTTLYGTPAVERMRAGFNAPELEPVLASDRDDVMGTDTPISPARMKITPGSARAMM